MANYEYMVQRARREVWCNPLMDHQYVFLPERVTTGFGALNKFFALDRWIPTPRPNVLTHIFQVGQLTPAQLNLIERVPSWTAEKWYTFSEAMNLLNVCVNIYNEDGVNIPRFTSYFMFTREKCLVFAIERDARIQYNSDEDRIYFRFYSNAYLSSEAAAIAGAKIETKGYNITNMTSILAAQRDYTEAKSKYGYTEAFVNGFLVPEIGPVTVRAGDCVEWVQDGSVKRVVTWTVRDLLPFTSTMDKQTKLILHYQADNLNTIDYQDDIDLFIHTPTVQNRYKGRYYPKNQPMAMRNLTHRDYSVPGIFVDFISRALARDLSEQVPALLDMKLKMIVREGGWDRPLIKDSHRIFELYKLRDIDVLGAMSGMLSAPPVWYANDLESSPYPEVMRSLYRQVNIINTEGAYGYSSMSQILADTPQKTFKIGDFNVVNPPEILQKQSTFYEFNEAGEMLGWHRHENDDDYSTRNADTRLVEGIVGYGTERPATQYGRTGIPVPDVAQYRVYYRQEIPGQPLGKWQDITGDRRYTIEAGAIRWLSTESNYMLMVRSNENFLAYDTLVTPSQGLIRFQLSEVVNKGQGFQSYPMEVPMGQLQLWLNGHNLVRNVDYVYIFPNIYINNYAFLMQPSDTVPQRLHVRFTGFCTKDLQLDDEFQFGFVEHGALSNNRRYNLHDDKVLHISVAGNVYDRTDLKFFEDRPGYDILNPMNGRPYQIAAVVPPLRDYVKTPWPELRQESLKVDKVVSDYLTEYMNRDPIQWRNSAAISRWPLVSPFFSHILYRLRAGSFFLQEDATWTDEQVIAMCKGYEPLFETDPLNEAIELPEKFVVIRPHGLNNTINLTRTQYRFLMRVVQLYGRGKIGINSFVTFTV